MAKSEDNIQSDLIVIGAGGGGLAAAVAASDKGVRNIVVLEALNAPGGNSLFPEGLFAVNSKLQDRMGIRPALTTASRQ